MTTPDTKTEKNIEIQQDAFFIKIRKKLTRIYWNDVVCISTGRIYISAKINRKDFPEVPIRCTLQQALHTLIPDSIKENFIQISRFHCINIVYVKQLQNDMLITDYGSFEISNRYKSYLMQKLNIIN